jgi:hypothetical protein
MQWTTTQDQFAEGLARALEELAADEGAVCAVLEVNGRAIVIRKAIGNDDGALLYALGRSDLAGQYGVTENRVRPTMYRGELALTDRYRQNPPELVYVVGDRNQSGCEQFLLDAGEAHGVANRYCSAIRQARSEHFPCSTTLYRP